MDPICSATIRPRTFEERDKRVHEATFVGTAFIIRGEYPNRQYVPLAVVYGESRQEVSDRLMEKLKPLGYSGFDTVND